MIARIVHVGYKNIFVFLASTQLVVEFISGNFRDLY